MNKFGWNPHDYWIYFVNIDLGHQCGISVAESQTFLGAKRPQPKKARRNGCFRRLPTSASISVVKLNISNFKIAIFPLTKYKETLKHMFSVYYFIKITRLVLE